MTNQNLGSAGFGLLIDPYGGPLELGPFVDPWGIDPNGWPLKVGPYIDPWG